MGSENDEPADLASFRARREELKRERRRKKAAGYESTAFCSGDTSGCSTGRSMPPASSAARHPVR
jgi:hypothetical protein